MANITNTVAIKFSNEKIRTCADKMAQAYYRASSLLQRWTALGSGQTALDQMQAQFKTCQYKLLDLFDSSWLTERTWYNGVSSLFPNDSSPVFDNGSATGQDTTRPAITGAMVTNIITRGSEFQNWLFSIAGSFTAIPQVETATAVGTISGTGNATVVVTANLMTGSPKTVSVAVTSGDTATVWAGKVRTALAADTTVNAFFTISGATTSIVLTAITAAANDSTMNISLANGTSVGITAAPTSANTTAGVAVRGGTGYINTVLQAGDYAPATIVLADAQNFVTRCTELKTNYEASSSANLNTILAVSVNPNS